jgi:protein-L-isoaspartate(D-aspartate) O-methyltransferase
MLPVGTIDQSLCLFEQADKGFVETRFDPVRFVPLLPGVE